MTIIPDYFIKTPLQKVQDEDDVLKSDFRRAMDSFAASLQFLNRRIVSLIEKNPSPGQKAALEGNRSFCKESLRILQKMHASEITHFHSHTNRIEIFQERQLLVKAMICVRQLQESFAVCLSNVAQIQANFKSVKRKLEFVWI